MTMRYQDLTISDAQRHQPWTVPYALGVLRAASSDVPHILATHDCLHAMKSLGKLAAVFESLDHTDGRILRSQLDIVKDMSADLLTAALRLGNLYHFDVAEVLVHRVEEKNGVDILALVESKGDK